MSKLSNHIDSGNLHHAYLIEGRSEEIVPELFDFLNSIGIQTKANPDVWYRTFDTFTIDDARELKGFQIQKEISGERKMFIIRAEFFTTEAQNALLKVFEEPAPGVHFFIVTPRADRLLGTLQSRLVVIRPEKSQGDAPEIMEEGFVGQAKKFIGGEREDRLEFVKILIKKYEKEDTSTPLKIEALSFLDNLEHALQEKTKQGRKKAEDYHPFEEIWKCRSYMNQRGASVKMLLEHLALVL